MELSIISLRTPHTALPLKKYVLDAIDTVGVEPREPFGIVFRNTENRKIQVRLSVDGTDVLTGGKATMAPDGQMWVLDPFDSMRLEAWPETTRGGARFIFGEPGSSVALHTHGDTRAVGYISAAVFTEGQPVPVPRVTRPRLGGSAYAYGDLVLESFDPGDDTGEVERTPAAYGGPDSKSPRRAGPATGAGEYVAQQVLSAKGLRRPVFSQLVQLRYRWWDEVVEQLRAENYRPAAAHPTGFEPPMLANLGSTPRYGDERVTVTNSVEYGRYA